MGKLMNPPVVHDLTKRFHRKSEDEQEDGRVLSVRLNDAELVQLAILRQVKPATALKMLAKIGSIVIHMIN